MHTRSWQAAYDHVFGAERLAGIDVSRRRGMWERALGDVSRDVFVFEDGGEVVAFVGSFPSRDADAEGELGEIYALPEAWGKGVGRALMTACVAALRERGYADAILWVLDENPRARAFYEREGWALDGAEKTEQFLGVTVRELRYRVSL
ncbi:MAG TPA: GNAT family N-acetyltransferase [Gaiellaceae bacterium]